MEGRECVLLQFVSASTSSTPRGGREVVKRNRINLKAGATWEIHVYKGEPRVVMNRNNFLIKQPVTPYDVLSVGRVKRLVGWLNRYLHTVEPTEKSVVIAGLRANARGVQRNLQELEASQ